MRNMRCLRGRKDKYRKMVKLEEKRQMGRLGGRSHKKGRPREGRRGHGSAARKGFVRI